MIFCTVGAIVLQLVFMINETMCNYYNNCIIYRYLNLLIKTGSLMLNVYYKCKKSKEDKLAFVKVKHQGEKENGNSTDDSDEDSDSEIE